MTEDTTKRPLNPYGRVGDLTVLVGNYPLYSPLTHLLWERVVGVLRVESLDDLPRVWAAGEQRVAIVCSADRPIRQWAETIQPVPILVELDPTGDVVAVVEHEASEEDDWCSKLPWLTRLAQETLSHDP